MKVALSRLHFESTRVSKSHSRPVIGRLNSIRLFSQESKQHVLKEKPGGLLRARLDFKWIKDNQQSMLKNLTDRRYQNANELLQQIVELYDKRTTITQELNTMYKKKKEIAQSRNIELGRAHRQKIAELEHELATIEGHLQTEALKLPNTVHPSVPLQGEGNLINLVGEKPYFDFSPKDHLQIASELDLVDFDSAATVTGEKFYYLKNEGALLELALVNWSMHKLVTKGYTPVMAPDLVRHELADGCGFQPRGESSQIYNIEGHNLCLTGTAEIPLCGMYAGQIIPVDKLPIKLVGFGHAFRLEAGSRGQVGRGLYRVHQFSKVEMFTFGSPLTSDYLHEEMLEIEKELFSELGLHFRVLDMPVEDLGAPAYRKYDIEAWMPSRNSYGEISSTSNCTDYQSRRLNIRMKIQGESENRFVHTINGTACAVPRMILSLLENYQQSDGVIKIPKVLIPYMGGISEIVPKKTK